MRSASILNKYRKAITNSMANGLEAYKVMHHTVEEFKKPEVLDKYRQEFDRKEGTMWNYMGTKGLSFDECISEINSQHDTLEKNLKANGTI